MRGTVDGLMVVDVDGRESAFEAEAVQSTIRQSIRPELVEPTLTRLAEVLRRVKVRRLDAGTIRSLLQEITDDASEERLERIVKADANVLDAVLEPTVVSTQRLLDQPDGRLASIRLRRAFGLYARQTLAKRLDKRFERIARYLQQLEETIVAHARSNSESPEIAQRDAVDRIQQARRLLYHPRDLYTETGEELEESVREFARARAYTELALPTHRYAIMSQDRTSASWRMQVSIHRVDCLREGAPTLGADEFFHRGQFTYEDELATFGSYDHFFDSGETHEPRRYRISLIDPVPGRRTTWFGTHFAAERDLCDPATADAMARIVAILSDLSAKAGLAAVATPAAEEVRRICEQNGVPFEKTEGLTRRIGRHIEEIATDTIADVQSELCHFLNRALGPGKLQPTPFASRVHIDWTDPSQPPIWTAFLNQRQVGGVQVGAVEIVSHRINLIEAVESDDADDGGHYRMQFRFHMSTVR